MDQVSFLRDCVITVTSDDYEEFDLIFEQTERVASARGMSGNEEEVAGALRSVIADGFVDAYILSPHRPYSTKVEFTPEQLHDLWYYVTPLGKNQVKGIPFLLGESE
jgi:hypothetical protein